MPGTESGRTQARPGDLAVIRTPGFAPALIDALTGLPQRPLIREWLGEALAVLPDGGHVAAALVNVDGFCVVIESLGMAAADAALQQLAGRLRDAAATAGLRVARAGGDEFGLVVPAVADQGSAERLVGEVVAAAFDRPLSVHGHVLYLTASSGIALSPPAEPDELLRRATLALSSVKRAGGGRTAVFSPRPTRGPRNLALYAELREAMARNELAPHYQPIVDITGPRVIGLEALLRWSSPTRGVVSPAEFLPPIAASPLIEDLGLRVLRQACQDAAALMSTHPDLGYVAVNVAARQLTRPQFAEQVVAALAAADLSPQHLVLEVTETALVHDLSVARAALDALRDNGIRIALDDFGTGYATLTSLRQLPIDMLKIDRSFVAGLGESNQDATIVASVVALARSVGIDAVAEGVETARQAEAVRAIGCRLGQGYFWSPAVPAAAVPATLAEINRSSRRPPRKAAATEAAATKAGAETVETEPAESDQAAAQRDEQSPPTGPVQTRRILELHRGGASPRTIAAALNQAGLLTTAGRRWHPVQVTRVIDSALDP